MPGEKAVKSGESGWVEPVEMGANTSQVSDLSDNPSLKALVGTESISENDPFWNQLISFTFISPTSRYANTHKGFIYYRLWRYVPVCCRLALWKQSLITKILASCSSRFNSCPTERKQEARQGWKEIGVWNDCSKNLLKYRLEGAWRKIYIV